MNYYSNILLISIIFLQWILPFSSASQYPSKRKLKILVYSPSFAYSHAQFMGKIADTLQQAGHDVVNILTIGIIKIIL
jgi:hypothetical protein